MITDERLASFINSFNSDYDEILTAIRKEAEEGDVPIIRTESAEFMKLLMLINKPVDVLEIGTATAYSAIFMAKHTPPETHITTIENYPPRIELAKVNIARANMADKITLLEGDANEILGTLNTTFDFIFMDAAKGQYSSFYDKCIPLLKTGGILLCDNVLQDGDVLESRFTITRRNRTIHSRMREFLYTIKHDSRLETAIMNIGDGMSLSVKM